MSFGDRLQALRRGTGMTQDEFAQQLNVSSQAVSKWESAQAQPDLDRIVALSELFAVTTDFLLKGSRGGRDGDGRSAPPEGAPAPGRRFRRPLSHSPSLSLPGRPAVRRDLSHKFFSIIVKIL